MPKNQRVFLNKKHVKQILKEVAEQFKLDSHPLFSERSKVEQLVTDDFEIYYFDNQPLFFKKNSQIYPTLLSDNIFKLSSKIIVDMGAILYICSGANVMRPGVIGFEGAFEKGDIVFIVDEKHKRPLAIGTAFYKSTDATNLKRGLIAYNEHFVGDKLWKVIKQP